MGDTGHNALYNPNMNSWSLVPDFPKLNNGLQEAAADNEAAVLPNGNVLVITSVFTCSTQNCYWMAPARWFEYDVASNSWLSVPDDPAIPSSSNIANGVQLVDLPNGQVMVTGAGHVEFYTSAGTSNPAWSPVIDNVSATDLSPGNNYSISGKQLAGLTQGSFWGDEQQNATNYGLVQITNNATHHVFYARSFNFSNTSIAPNAPSTLSFSIDSSVENGSSALRVIASGFASTPIDVNISGGVTVAQTVKPTPSASPTPTSSPSPQASPIPTPQHPADSKAKVNKKSITCLMGTKIKKVSAVNPKCPTGYKLKK
jgi:hypothetical protein